MLADGRAANWEPHSWFSASFLSNASWAHVGLEHEDKNGAYKEADNRNALHSSSSDSDDDYDYDDDHDYDCDYDCDDDDDDDDDDGGSDKAGDDSRTLHLVLRDRRALGPPPGFEEIDTKVPVLKPTSPPPGFGPLLKLKTVEHDVELKEEELEDEFDLRPCLISGFPVCESRVARGETREQIRSATVFDSTRPGFVFTRAASAGMFPPSHVPTAVYVDHSNIFLNAQLSRGDHVDVNRLCALVEQARPVVPGGLVVAGSVPRATASSFEDLWDRYRKRGCE